MRYKKLSFLMLIVLMGILSVKPSFAQSLSDFQWDKFVGKTSQKEVQSHTDPFSSGVSSANDLSIEELQLSGIVFRDENDAYALISGYLVSPGDRIAGYRVDLIEKDKVQLKRVDDIFILALGGGI